MKKRICVAFMIAVLLFFLLCGNGFLQGSEDAVASRADEGSKDNVWGIIVGVVTSIVCLVTGSQASECEDDPLRIDDPDFDVVHDGDGIHVGDHFVIKGSVSCYAGRADRDNVVVISGRISRKGEDWYDWFARKEVTFEGGGDRTIEFEFGEGIPGHYIFLPTPFQAADEGTLVVEVRASVAGYKGKWFCWNDEAEEVYNPSDWLKHEYLILAPYQWDVEGPSPDDEVHHCGSISDDTLATLTSKITSYTQANLTGDLYVDGKKKSFELVKFEDKTLVKTKGCPHSPHPLQDPMDFYFEDIRLELKIVLGNGGCWEKTVTKPDEMVLCHGHGQMHVFSKAQIPWADLWLTPLKIYEGKTLSFDTVSTGFAPPFWDHTWYFSDGSTSSDMPATRFYDNDCLDTVVLVASYPLGRVSYAESAYVNIRNLNPIIDNISVIDSAGVGAVVEFHATASDSGVNDTLTYWWFFGDGDSASGASATHAYLHYGTYSWALIITDGDYGFDATSGLMWITGEVPVADAGGPYTGYEGYPIEFLGSGSTDPDADTTVSGWTWHFGDGDSGYACTTTHTYVNDGTYYAALTVIDDNALESAPDIAQVIVHDVDPEFRRVTFDYETTDSVRLSADYNTPNPFIDSLTYIWAFGDGDFDTGQVVHHRYDPGQYTVTLRVEDEDSHVDTTWPISIPVDESQVSKFTLRVSPSYQQVWPSDSSTYDTVEAISINNFSSPLEMSVEDLPYGTDATFTNLRSVHPYARTTLILTTSIHTPPGLYELTVKGEGGGKEAIAPFTLEVLGACDTTLQVLLGGLIPVYYWQQPPYDRFINMQFEIPQDYGGRLQSFNIAFYSDGSTGAPDPDFYVWPSDGMFPFDNNPPLGALLDFHISHGDIVWYPGRTTVQAYFHNLIFDPGEKFHIGFCHDFEPDDALACLSDDGSMGSERSSGWDGFGWTTYSPYEFLIDAVICPIAPTFTMGVTPPLAVIAPGDQWMNLYQIEVGSLAGYAMNVTLGLVSVNPPEDISASFTPNGMPPPYVSDVAIGVPEVVPEGDYILTFQGFGDDMQIHTCDVALRVQWPMICGNFKRDGEVDLGDVVELLNYLFKGGPSPESLCLGDVNCDSTVDLEDAIHLVNYLFKGGAPPCEECCSLKARTEKSPIQTIERDSQPIRRNPERIPQAPGDLKRIR